MDYFSLGVFSAMNAENTENVEKEFETWGCKWHALSKQYLYFETLSGEAEVKYEDEKDGNTVNRKFMVKASNAVLRKQNSRVNFYVVGNGGYLYQEYLSLSEQKKRELALFMSNGVTFQTYSLEPEKTNLSYREKVNACMNSGHNWLKLLRDPNSCQSLPEGHLVNPNPKRSQWYFSYLATIYFVSQNEVKVTFTYGGSDKKKEVGIFDL